MAKKAIERSYIMKDYEIDAMRVCFNNDIAFCVKPCYNESTNYWIQRLKISDTKSIFHLRIDTSLPDTESNRVRLNLFNATKKIFELYVEYSKKLI